MQIFLIVTFIYKVNVTLQRCFTRVTADFWTSQNEKMLAPLIFKPLNFVAGIAFSNSGEKCRNTLARPGEIINKQINKNPIASFIMRLAF